MLERNHNEWITKISPDVIKWRRELHMNAEIGFCEYVTTHYIYESLKNLDFELFLGKEVLQCQARLGVPSKEELAKHEERALAQGVPEDYLEKMNGGFTGMVARLYTGKPGKHFALRFDIDALPIGESTDPAHFPVRDTFRSQNNGMMHACGHDGHTAIGLGIAHFLHDHIQFLNGSFTLLFQPAEEGCRGANAMVQKGWLDNVDYFLSGHIGIQDLSVGTIVSSVTDILATTKIDVDLIGKTAHAGLRPHEGKNALLAGTTLVQALHSIAPHGDGMTRLNVGKFSAGIGRNIVPGNASLQLETRGVSTKENNYMKKEVFERIEGVAKMYGVEANYSIVGEAISATSDSGWHDVILDASQSSNFITNVQKSAPFNASEDVTFMMKYVQETGGKSVFMLYGTPLVEGHHHCAFDFDEGTLSVALSALIEVIWKLK